MPRITVPSRAQETIFCDFNQNALNQVTGQVGTIGSQITYGPGYFSGTQGQAQAQSGNAYSTYFPLPSNFHATFSIAMWVQTGTLSAVNQSFFWSHAIFGNFTNGIMRSYIGTNFQLYIDYIDKDGNRLNPQVTTVALSNGTKYFIVWTFDGSTVSVYLNGVSIYSTAFKNVLDNMPYLTFGSDTFGSSGNFIGTISNTICYNHALIQAEVTAMNALTVPPVIGGNYAPIH